MAVQKLSQITAAGGPPAVTDQAVFVTGGAVDNLVTVTQLGAALPLFTSTTRGQVPLSGGGTTNFLRADGTFAAPPTTAPGGLNTQVQFNNAGAFGGITNVISNGTNLTGARLGSAISLDWDNGAGTVDLSLFRDATNILAARVGVTNTPMGIRVYNNATGGAAEYGVADWNIAANVYVVGTQASGGTLRAVGVTAGGKNWTFDQNGSLACSTTALTSTGGGPVFIGTNAGGYIRVGTGGNAGYYFNTVASGDQTPDTGLGRIAAKVVGVNDGASINTNGWIQTAGDLRLGSDVGFTSNVVLATIMSVALQAGRSYAFDVYFSITGSAGGFQAAMVASGGLTATAIQYDGYVVDNAAAGTKGAAQASALGTVVANPATITGPASATIRGLITVNVAGTIQIQASQGTSSATTTTVKRGSWAFFRDTP